MSKHKHKYAIAVLAILTAGIGTGTALGASLTTQILPAVQAGSDGRDAEAVLDGGPGFSTVTARLQESLKRVGEIRDRRALEAPVIAGIPRSTLESIAACESGGDPAAVSSGGDYRGKYQFDYGTWASIGGHGDPAAASELEQDYRAALLYQRVGSGPWPVCG